MNTLLVIVVVSAVWFLLGWQCCSARAAGRVFALRKVLNATAVDAARLRMDNQRLAQWCGRFREMYLETVALVDPVMGAALRRKWAAVQAPEVVARELDRHRHG